MKNIISWLKESNRWKHLLGGFFISLITNIIFANTTSIIIGIYCSFCCAASLELKDKQCYAQMWHQRKHGLVRRKPPDKAMPFFAGPDICVAAF